jgi:hypothetical protein
MKVLKELMLKESDGGDENDDTDAYGPAGDIQRRLLCTVTAFELLSGQGSQSLKLPCDLRLRH